MGIFSCFYVYDKDKDNDDVRHVYPGKKAYSSCETCYYILTEGDVTLHDIKLYEYVFGGKLHHTSRLTSEDIVERGPKLHVQSTWGGNARNILNKCGGTPVIRIEKFIRGPYTLLSTDLDNMVQHIYSTPLSSFGSDDLDVAFPTSYIRVPCVMKALWDYICDECLGIEYDDLLYYYDMWTHQHRLFVTELELHDIAQCNSEHSRHNIFRATMCIEGADGTKTLNDSLMHVVKAPLDVLKKQQEEDNSVVAFSDNSSAIKGGVVDHLLRLKPDEGGSAYCLAKVDVNTLFSAETHNFPTGIAPFPGAATGTGGRIRDVQAIGRGGMFVAGMCGYCVSPLGLPSLSDIENPLDPSECLYSGADMLIQASNGASDYGNKIGEPVIQGFTRTFGMDLPYKIGTKRREWIKPIMFTSGIGMVYTEQLHKCLPAAGMLVARVGGPSYRIGVGGGSSSSSCQVVNDLDKYLSSVQRGDPEMEQKVDRFLRSCIEFGVDNPILSIHDQGAGGMSNVTKEIVESPDGSTGAIIDIRKVVSGDNSMSLKELWIAEYQEQNTFLTSPSHVALLERIAQRENVPLAFIGEVTDDGRFVVYDSLNSHNDAVVDFDLKKLTRVPTKTFDLPYIGSHLDDDVSLLEGSSVEFGDVQRLLACVLKHPTVCSKRFLTNKVDRSVSGLIAQQQCVGPLHTPLADAAVIAHSYFGCTGAVTSIGEKPIIGISNPAAMARMAVAEMLTNMVWVKIHSLRHIKCSGNWMWPGAEHIEKHRMYNAAVALRDIMTQLGVAIDGGKDSLSMSSTTRVSQEKVDCPPQIVISGYSHVPDITQKVTPDLKKHGSLLIWARLNNRFRLGGSILTQVLNRSASGVSGIRVNDYPDLDHDDITTLSVLFDTLQLFVQQHLILSGHDVSDGGGLSAILEMAFAGNKGVNLGFNNIIDAPASFMDVLSLLFSEDPGVIIEVSPKNLDVVGDLLFSHDIYYRVVGGVTDDNCVTVDVDGSRVLDSTVTALRDTWESTSFDLEKIQSNHTCVAAERKMLVTAVPRKYGDLVQRPYTCSDDVWSSLSSDHFNCVLYKHLNDRPRVAVIREEGSNGDREMCAALWLAGFHPFDVATNDIIRDDSRLDLTKFHGIVFVGGFAFSDVFGAAKGWAAILTNSPAVRQQLDWYYSSNNTTRFSLGVCNGCQLMCRLGWVGECIDDTGIPPIPQQNISGRFESRFVKLKILASNSVLLQGMEDCVLGTWVAHGEGRYNSMYMGVEYNKIDKNSFPLRYVKNDFDEYTTQYPYNPNGSSFGIAGALSKNGLHLAMMPHPERCIKSWQNPWIPDNWKPYIDNTYDGMSMPWMRMFINAYNHCVSSTN